MKKSERPRNRYIAFEVLGEHENVENYIYKEVLRFFGEYGFSKLGFKVIEYDSKSKNGIIRCNRDWDKKMIGFLALLNNPRVKSLKTSGTIKALKEKVNKIKS